MNCERFGPAARVDPGRLEAVAYPVRGQPEASGQGISQGFSSLGEGCADDGMKAPLIGHLDPGTR